MARLLDKEKAIKLRRTGMSYSQIKQELGINKSTLSGWLAPYPLSSQRIKELRDWSSKRIENYRATMQRKREDRFSQVYNKVRNDLGKLTKREIILGGIFLYWGEGYKTSAVTTGIANTDPAMLRFCVKWLKAINAPLEKIKIKIHIYSDMDENKTISYWKKELKLPSSCFGQMYIKKSKLAELSYKNGFGHGTCNILIHNRDLKEYIVAALRYLREEISKV